MVLEGLYDKFGGSVIPEYDKRQKERQAVKDAKAARAMAKSVEANASKKGSNPSSASKAPSIPNTLGDSKSAASVVESRGVVDEDLAMRRTKWEYVIPIVFTPAAHIFVSLVRQYPQHKRKLYWGVGIATLLTIQTRLILMYDAGYPGGETSEKKDLPSFLRYLLF